MIEKDTAYFHGYSEDLDDRLRSPMREPRHRVRYTDLHMNVAAALTALSHVHLFTCTDLIYDSHLSPEIRSLFGFTLILVCCYLHICVYFTCAVLVMFHWMSNTFLWNSAYDVSGL